MCSTIPHRVKKADPRLWISCDEQWRFFYLLLNRCSFDLWAQSLFSESGIEFLFILSIYTNMVICSLQ